jgi:hypothetical protein
MAGWEHTCTSLGSNGQFCFLGPLNMHVICLLGQFALCDAPTHAKSTVAKGHVLCDAEGISVHARICNCLQYSTEM